MDKQRQTPESQLFKEYIGILVKNHTYSDIERKAELRKGFISDALNESSNRATAKAHHNEKVFEAYREELDPAFSDETIKEKVIRLDEEMEDLKKEFEKQQALWEEKKGVLDLATKYIKLLEQQKEKDNE